LGTASNIGETFAFFVVTPAPDRPTITVTPATLRQYTGTYSQGPLDADDDQIITLDGDSLMLQAGLAQEKQRLFAESETRFFTRSDMADDDVQFVKDDQGVVTHLSRSGGAKWIRK
jgi:hypothetical protein